jgi:MSHA pilin protein MshD
LSTVPDRLMQRGLTLIELVIFISVITIGVTAILHVLTFNTRFSADPLRRKQALALAEGLLEEVAHARYTYCDPQDPAAETAAKTADCTIKERFGLEAGNGGRPYDNINDYVSAPGVAVAAFNAGGALTDATGAAFPIAGYSATVKITPEPYGGIPAVAGADSAADAEALRITVTVAYDNEQIVLEGYRTRYAPGQLP